MKKLTFYQKTRVFIDYSGRSSMVFLHDLKIFSPMKILTRFILAILLLIGFSSFEKTVQRGNYTTDQINNFVREVFADQSDVLVFKSTSGRQALIVGFLDRFQIINKSQYKDKQYRLLSSIPLVNKYNPNLRRDAAVSPATFNPLKYAFPMSSTKKEIFRVDATDYVIIIEPLK